MKYLKSINIYNNKIYENVFSEQYYKVSETISDYVQDIKISGGDISIEIINGFLSNLDDRRYNFTREDDGKNLKDNDYNYAFWVVINLTSIDDDNAESVIKNIGNINNLCNSVKNILSYLKRDKVTRNYKYKLYVDDIIRLDNNAVGDGSTFTIRFLLYNDEYMTKEEINKYNESI